MQTTLDMQPETELTTIGNGGYEGFWAASGTLGIVVDDDRIADNPINGVDPSGLWTIKRDRHKLAIAEPGPDDTIRTLASTLKLNPDEYHKWLTVATPEAYSQNPEKDDGIHIGLDDKVTGNGKCKYQTFLVPNLIVIDYGTSGDWKTKWTGADQAFSIWYYLEQLGEQLKDTFGAQKYMVQENFGADNAAIVGHLTNDTEDKSLYGYFFFGHGGDGSINTGGSQEVSDGEYTTYGIAMMGLYSCESNLPGPGESENQWKYNVSPTGVIRTSPVDLTRLNLPDKVMVTTNGAVKP